MNPPPVPSDVSPTRFASEVAGLAARTPPRPSPVVAIGSSSFTLWFTIDADLGGLGIVNHGFGGSKISDCNYFHGILVAPYSPRVVVLCAGDNDLADNRTVARVLQDFEEFARLTWSASPKTKILFVAIKPSLARWHLYAEQTRLNETIRRRGRQEPRLGFIDIRPVMLGADGRPKAELFLEDGLHLSVAGYVAWAGVFGPQLQSALAESAG